MGEGGLLLWKLSSVSRAMPEGEEAMVAATLDARFWLGSASARGAGFWEGTGGVPEKAATAAKQGVYAVKWTAAARPPSPFFSLRK
jgi:hypothetical protein